MKITRINHAAVNVVGKVEEARAFYVELLGLPEIPIQIPGRPPVVGAKGAFWLEQEGVQLHVIGRESMGDPPDPTQSHVSWYVEDLDVVVKQLGERELKTRVLGEGQNRIVWVLDPAGNVVEFQQDPKCAPAQPA
jgi:catechol 2,3-dioxygenase-like lactoylglutathione lyase family enzyme